MEQLHEFTAGPDEDEDITVLHFALHLFMDQTAERTDSFAHVRPAGTQEVAHRVVQAKHGCFGDFGSTVPPVASQTRFQSGHEDRWEIAGPRLVALVLPGKIPWLPV